MRVGAKPVAGLGEVALQALRLAAGLAVVGVGLGLPGFGGLHGLAGGGVAGRQGGDARVEGLGLVEPGLGLAAAGFGGLQRAGGGVGLGGALGEGVGIGGQGGGAGAAALLGTGQFSGERLQPGEQRPGRLHGLDAGEPGPARGGGVVDGLGLAGLAFGLGDGLLQSGLLAEPRPADVEPDLPPGEGGLGGDEAGSFGLAGLARFGGQRGLVGQLPLEPVEGLLLGLHALIGELRELGVGLGAGEGLQQLGALVVGGLQEGREVVLGEQHGAGELLEAEADALFDGLLDLLFGVTADGLPVGDADEADLGVLQLAVLPSVGSLHRPAGAPGDALAADVVHLGKALGGAPAQQGARVGGGGGVLAHVGDLAPRAGAGEARGALEEGQAQGVEQGALAGAGGAGDREEAGRGEGLGLEVDLELAGQRGQVPATDRQDLHAAPSSAGVASSSPKAAISSGGASLP